MSILEEPSSPVREIDWRDYFWRQPGAIGAAGANVREWVSLLLVIVAGDLLLFRGGGFVGFAIFFGVALCALLGGTRVRTFHWSLVLQSILVALLCARLAWQGSPLQVLCGFVLIAAFATSLAGLAPYLATVGLMVAQCSIAGVQFLTGYLSGLPGSKPNVDGFAIFKVLLPVMVVSVFGTIFIMANPDAVTVVYRQIASAFDELARWISRLDLSVTEVLFWVFTAWITVGLFRPMAFLKSLRLETAQDGSAKPAETPLYATFRNTLLAVILLFAGYLVVEFATLWFRKFPKDFYYAGYAHQGAAWLTIALALSTAVLSAVFNRATALDPRAKRLRVLAYVWSFENLLLSIAVYNRLFIYIGYNGMTHWRIVGIFGISVVVAGFALVVWKIIRDKSFLWLVHRQLWALSTAVFLFAIAPVDAIAVRYNANRIARGDIAACMQIGVQRLDTESKLFLIPLLECSDLKIREGVKAILATEYQELTARQYGPRSGGWTHQRGVDFTLAKAINRHKTALTPMLDDDSSRRAAIAHFYEYAYQWY